MKVIILNIREKTCCFTCHRDISLIQRFVIKRRLEAEIKRLIDKGVVYFGSGGALGFDTMAALMVLKLKTANPQIKLILVLPCREQADRWSNADKMLYNEILQKADKVKYTSEHYSGYCICYLTQKAGGTAYTVDYAKKHKLDITNLAARKRKEGI